MVNPNRNQVTDMARMGKVLVAALIAGAVTSSVRKYLETNAPGGPELWTRTNHRGEPITLLEGPAVTAGITAGTLFSSHGLSGAVAALGGGAFGLYDDLREDPTETRKGFKGHLGALARGELTTGGIKILGIGGAAFASSCLLNVPRPGRGTVDVLLDTAIIASSANFINLLDLRPGRALKFVGGSAALLGLVAGSAQAGALLGAGAAAASRDLAEQDMLGDCGANSMGALLGQAFCAHNSRTARILSFGFLAGLTLASEKVSFSEVIAQTSWLNKIDRYGRRPAHTPEQSPQG